MSQCITSCDLLTISCHAFNAYLPALPLCAVNTAAGAGSSGGAHSHESSGAILNEEGLVHWSNFLALLSSGPGALAKRWGWTRTLFKAAERSAE
jgi:hypothetical protein